MKPFTKTNNIIGWALFLISAVVYTLTVEETASFWDCGEFIAVSYKLEVPHPPGAPFYLMLGRLFSFLALGDVTQVAFWINMLSVLSSALTITFLYWTIVLLAMKFIRPEGDHYDQGQLITIFGAGIVGALAYTFSDSFWFSAVEAEVYALSSLFTAFVVWAVLRWELIEDEQYANKWLIMVTYTMGLSIGVHLLNLVTIPALALIIYFKKSKKITTQGIGLSLFTGLVIIFIILSGVITGLPSIAGWFEIAFVNSFGLPFGSGIAFFIVLLIGGLVYGLYYSHQKAMKILNMALLGITFVLIGYTTYGLIPIRSNFNPAIDENNPEDIITFVRYLKREQYGNRPLIYGNTFDAARVDVERKAPIYRKAETEYEVYDYRTEPVYEKDRMMLLPRIYSQQPGHEDLYRQKIGLRANEKPNMFDNIYYMFTYQFGHMYFRYFMWNFASRESDEKEAGWMLPWEDWGVDLPEELARNKGRNNFYMLPLLLGIIGLFFHLVRDEKFFWVVMLLFFLTGLGLVLYLNSPPVEPRERDYIYVGSFYAFCIWIGLGVPALREMFAGFLKGKNAASIAATALGLVIPTVMAADGWDNHDRSNRFHSIDQAKNTLRSCAPNAVLFTGGDNDTFPLWYVQEVEGFRTDVRVVVLSYFSTDWYIEQMRRKVNESEALPLTISPKNYLQGTNDYVPLVPSEGAGDGAVNLKTYIRFVNENNPRVQVPLQDGSTTAKLVSRYFSLNIDKQEVLSLEGVIPDSKRNRVVDKMVWGLKEGANAIFKNDLAILDLIATSDWKRPIYFNNTSANTTNLEVRPWLHLEGMAYRLLPIRANNEGDVGEVNTDVMLANMSEFEFRGFDDPSTYHDEEYRKFGSNTRNSYARLVQSLIDQGRDDEALNVLNEAMENIPDETIPYSYFTTRFVELYYQLGDREKAEEIASTLSRRADENLQFWIEHESRDDMLRQKSLLYLNQLLLMYRRLEQEASAEVTRLEDMQNLVQESASDQQLEAAKEAQTYYSEKYREFYDLFYKYIDLVEQPR